VSIRGVGATAIQVVDKLSSAIDLIRLQTLASRIDLGVLLGASAAQSKYTS
jgi:hypothetical protein